MRRKPKSPEVKSNKAKWTELYQAARQDFPEYGVGEYPTPPEIMDYAAQNADVTEGLDEGSDHYYWIALQSIQESLGGYSCPQSHYDWFKAHGHII